MADAVPCTVDPPYQIIIDGTTILEGYTLEQLRLFFEDENAVIYTTKCVKKELVILDKYAQVDENGHLNEILDKLVCINECSINKALLKDGVIKVPFAMFQNGTLSMMDPIQTGQTIDSHKVMVAYNRMKQRIGVFGFAETVTGLGPNSFFQAIGNYYDIQSHRKVRERIVRQLRSFRDYYIHSIEGEYDAFLQNVSRSGWWPDSTVCQAVADAFKCRLVILLSHEDQLFYEWWPGRSSYYANLRIIYLTNLDGLRYSALYDQVEDNMNNEVFAVDNFYQRRGPKLFDLSFKVCKGVYEFNFRNPLLENVLFARLRRRLRTLGFSKQRVLGDGNCTFRAIASQVENSQEEHATVRKAICKQLRENPEKYRDRIYQDYVDNMTRLSKWSDGTVLQACSDSYFCDVLSISCAEEEFAYVYTCLSDVPHCSRPDILLADCGRHNDVVVRGLVV